MVNLDPYFNAGFFAGFVLDGVSIILIVVPIGFPMIQNFGFDPI